VTAAQAILDAVPDEALHVQIVHDVLRENEQRRQAGHARVPVDEIRELCYAHAYLSPAREPTTVATRAQSPERTASPRLRSPEGARREAASRTTSGRHATAPDDALVEVQRRFSGLHILDLLKEDPAPDDVRVFAALTLDVVSWHGKVQAQRDARVPKFVRAHCAALSNQRAVDLLQSLLAGT
jgi:hypothetical protein